MKIQFTKKQILIGMLLFTLCCSLGTFIGITVWSFTPSIVIPTKADAD